MIAPEIIDERSGYINERNQFVILQFGTNSEDDVHCHMRWKFRRERYREAFGPWLEANAPDATFEIEAEKNRPWWKFWDLKMPYTGRAYIQFKNENDAFAFKLRWG